MLTPKETELLTLYRDIRNTIRLVKQKKLVYTDIIIEYLEDAQNLIISDLEKIGWDKYKEEWNIEEPNI